MFCHWSSSLEAKLRMHVLASISGVILMMEKHHRRDQLLKIYLDDMLHITAANIL